MAKAGNRIRRAELARLPDQARREALVELLRAAVAEAAHCAPEAVRVDWVDQNPMLLFLTLGTYILRDLGFLLLRSDVPHCHSIIDLATHLAGEVPMPPAPAAPLRDLYRAGWSDVWLPGRLYDPPLDRQIVFLLSPPRSGSTLLCSMLGRHPGLYGAQELHMLPFETMGARWRWFGPEELWVRLGLFQALTDLAGMTKEQAESEGLALEAQDVSVPAVYRRLQELAAGRIIVDKSASYASRLAWLECAEHVFRAPRYIHLTRHPGAVIESLVRRRFYLLHHRDASVPDENPWHYAERVWTVCHLHCLRFLRDVDPDRQLRVSYESVVSDPAAAVARICDFLQIPFDAATLQPYAGRGRILRVGDPDFDSHSGIDASLASDWESAKPPQSYGQITREVAEALGYALA